MDRPGSSVATKPFWASVGVELADRTTAIPAHAQAAKAKAEALGARAKTGLLEMKARRLPSEDEVVRAAIAVILGALVAIISLAAVAILTMG